MLDQLLQDLFSAGLEVGARKVKSAARRKSNRNVRPAFDVVAEFLDTLRKEEKARQRRSLNPARVDRATAARPTPPPTASVDPLRAFIDKAAAFVSQHSGVPAQDILANRAARDRAYRAAVKKLHPDKQGGDEALMQQLTAYWRVLKILDEVNP